MKNRKETIVVLDNIRSTHNVGSIFRTSDALGVSKIYLVGYTPKPVDTFGRPAKEIAKTALGAEKTIPWEAKEGLPALIRSLRREGFQIIAIEQSPKSVDYKKVKLAQRTALIVGNEVTGISKKTLSLCDVVAEIPMLGEKESLNASVSFGIAGFRLLDK